MTITKRDETPSRDADGAIEDALQRVRQALRGLRYGLVTVIVQDGVAVLVERTEKVRVTKKDDPS